jgi:hypothetical protein
MYALYALHPSAPLLLYAMYALHPSAPLLLYALYAFLSAPLLLYALYALYAMYAMYALYALHPSPRRRQRHMQLGASCLLPTTATAEPAPSAADERQVLEGACFVPPRPLLARS